MKVAQAALSCPGTVTVQFLFGNRAFRHKVGLDSPLTSSLYSSCCSRRDLVAPLHVSPAWRMRRQPSAKGMPACRMGPLAWTVVLALVCLALPALPWGSIVHFCSTSCLGDPAAATASCNSCHALEHRRQHSANSLHTTCRLRAPACTVSWHPPACGSLPPAGRCWQTFWSRPSGAAAAFQPARHQPPAACLAAWRKPCSAGGAAQAR